jgi:hypothetical protein
MGSALAAPATPRNILTTLESSFTQPRNVEKPDLSEAAKRINAVADLIEAHWNKLPGEVRKRLRLLAYSIVEPPKLGIGDRLRLLPIQLGWSLTVAKLLLVGQWELLAEYYVSLQRLQNAILDAVERENRRYSEQLGELTQQGLEEVRSQEGMRREQFDEWLRGVLGRRD